ncbi:MULTISPECIES: GNAT family N-acetyltransferase [unclassified Sphingobium]|uniref:GNAT family N-acetyltransferase n=1 Tax=unclassified Sphingobium TaxID=2611147 RepID=UPI0035A6E6B5
MDSWEQMERLSAQERQAIFRNCRGYWLGYGYADRIDERMTLYRSGVRDPQMNGVFWTADAAADIGVARQRLGDLPWYWWVGPDSHPDAAEILLANGARLVGSAPVMAAEVDKLEQPPVPEGYTVERLDESADLSQWVASYAPSMGIASTELPALSVVEKGRRDPPGALTRFAARQGDKIVAVSELFLSDNVAGIYLVATDAGHRRRGLGAAVTAAAIEHGRSKGARIATLQASPLGLPLYRRLGFVVVAEYRIFSLPGVGGMDDRDRIGE